MAVTDSSFLDSYPEFNSAGATLRAAKLAEATLEVDTDVWGDKADTGIMLTAAHKLAVSVYGQQARLSNEDGKTTYMQELMRLQRQVGHGYRLT